MEILQVIPPVILTTGGPAEVLRQLRYPYDVGGHQSESLEDLIE